MRLSHALLGTLDPSKISFDTTLEERKFYINTNPENYRLKGIRVRSLTVEKNSIYACMDVPQELMKKGFRVRLKSHMEGLKFMIDGINIALGDDCSYVVSHFLPEEIKLGNRKRMDT